MSCNGSEDRCWYYYIGAPGGEQALYNYILVDDVANCTPPGSNICGICAPSCGPNPSVLSTNILNYIALAKAMEVPQPALPVGAAKYVYPRAF